MILYAVIKKGDMITFRYYSHTYKLKISVDTFYGIILN